MLEGDWNFPKSRTTFPGVFIATTSFLVEDMEEVKITRS